MCYTTLGMEIVRVTLTDWPSGDKVLDALVRPIGEIMDLNSRFSGVFSHQFADAKDFISMFNPSKFPKARNENITFIEQPNSSPLVLRIFPNPQTARSEIFKYLSPTTPLLGHALENDLNVLRIIHPTIIDTAILFPHSRGLPIKNKLKWLVERFLKWKIQVQEKTTPVGHDSAVDARCAGELVRYKVKQRFGPWIKEVPPGITGKEKAKEGKNNNLHGGLKEIKDDPPLGMKTKERKKPEIVRVPSPKMSQAQKQQVSFGMADTLRLLKEQAGGAGGTINKLISSLNPQQNPFTMTNPTVTAPIAKGLKRQREPGTDSDSAITTTANGKQPPKRAIKLPITPTSAAISKHKPNAPFQEDDDDNDNESDVPELDLLNNGVCLPEK